MPSPLAALWPLDPTITFLNHGSFGSCPRPVLDAQRAWRDRLEAQPVQFLARDLPALLRDARGELGAFVGADPDDLAFVANRSRRTSAEGRRGPPTPAEHQPALACQDHLGRSRTPVVRR